VFSYRHPVTFRASFCSSVLSNRIVSGGQTGADRAALDWAVENGTPHGGHGWTRILKSALTRRSRIHTNSSRSHSRHEFIRVHPSYSVVELPFFGSPVRRNPDTETGRSLLRASFQTLTETVTSLLAHRCPGPPPPDRGTSRSAAAWLVERLTNASEHLDRATCCGRGPPALRWEYQDAPSLPKATRKPLQTRANPRIRTGKSARGKAITSNDENTQVADSSLAIRTRIPPNQLEEGLP
jgi:hypothetical protein